MDNRHIGHDYNLSPDAGPPTNATAMDEQDIHALIAKRMQCKMRRSFREANQIQRQLEQQYGVYVQDGMKEWRADGVLYEDCQAGKQVETTTAMTNPTNNPPSANKRHPPKNAKKLRPSLKHARKPARPVPLTLPIRLSNNFPRDPMSPLTTAAIQLYRGTLYRTGGR